MAELKSNASRFADWIVANEDKRGTPEFETVAEALKESLALESAANVQEEDSVIKAPKDPMSKSGAFGYGVSGGAGYGYDDDLVGQFNEEAGKRLKESKEQASEERPGMYALGNVVGSIPTTAALMYGGPRMIPAALPLLAAKYLPQAVTALRAARAAKSAYGPGIKETIDLAGRGLKSTAIGGGTGAIIGSGDAEEGEGLEGAKEGLKTGATIGALLHVPIEGLVGGAKGLYKAGRHLVTGQASRAKRAFNDMFPGQGISPEDIPLNAPDFKPMAIAPEMLEEAKALNPQLVAQRIAEQKASLKNIEPIDSDASISEPFVIGTNKINQESAANVARDSAAINARAAAVQAEADSARLSLTAEQARLGSVPPEGLEPKAGYAQNLRVSSEKAYGGAQKVLDTAEKKASDAWKAANVQNEPFNAQAREFKTKVNGILKEFEETQLDQSVRTRLDKILDPNRLKSLDAKGKDQKPSPVMLEEVQNLLSDLRKIARTSNDPNQARLARKLEVGIMEDIEKVSGVVSPGVLAKLKTAIAATNDARSKSDNFVTGRFTAEESMGASPQAFLANILTGSQGKAKQKLSEFLKTMEDDNKKVPKEILDEIEIYLSNDLFSEVSETGISKAALANWQAKYEGAFAALPKIFKEKFANPEIALKNAAEKVEAQKALKVDEELKAVAEKFKVIMPKSLSGDIYSPANLKLRMKGVLEDTRDDALPNFMALVGPTDGAVQGTRRLMGELILENKNPAAFITKYRDKLNKVFTDPKHQSFLDDLQAADINIKKKSDLLPSDRQISVLEHIRRTGIIALTRDLVGYFSSATGASAAQVFARRSKDAVDDYILAAIMNPTGPEGIALSRPYNPSKTDWMRGIYNSALPGIVGSKIQSNAIEDKRNAVQKKAAGGPVYTHPAISSIRANRAVSRMTS